MQLEEPPARARLMGSSGDDLGMKDTDHPSDGGSLRVGMTVEKSVIVKTLMLVSRLLTTP